MQKNALFSGKIYTAGTNFTRHSRGTVFYWWTKTKENQRKATQRNATTLLEDELGMRIGRSYNWKEFDVIREIAAEAVAITRYHRRYHLRTR